MLAGDDLGLDPNQEQPQACNSPSYPPCEPRSCANPETDLHTSESETPTPPRTWDEILGKIDRIDNTEGAILDLLKVTGTLDIGTIAAKCGLGVGLVEHRLAQLAARGLVEKVVFPVGAVFKITLAGHKLS
jgi:hypothetical protein